MPQMGPVLAFTLQGQYLPADELKYPLFRLLSKSTYCSASKACEGEHLQGKNGRRVLHSSLGQGSWALWPQNLKMHFLITHRVVLPHCLHKDMFTLGQSLRKQRLRHPQLAVKLSTSLFLRTIALSRVFMRRKVQDRA